MPWVHLLSFSLWVGANLFVLGMVFPASRGLPSEQRAETMRDVARFLNAIVAMSAPVAILSGVAAFWLQGTAAQFVGGFGTIFVLATKLILTTIMLLSHGLQAFRYHGCLGKPLAGRNMWIRLLVTNSVLGGIILLLGLSLRRLAI